MTEQRPRPKRKPPPPRKPLKQKTVWITCRAKAGCEGKQATLVFENKLPEGGTARRYRCLTCGGAFHITV